MTDIEICNLALSEVGEGQITAFSDKANIGLENIYKIIRDNVLILYPWDFALKRTRLTAKGLLDCSTRTITFVNSNPDTITDSGSGFVTAGFEAGDKVKVGGSGSNDTTYKIVSVAAGTLTLEKFEEVVAGTLANDTDLKLYVQPAYFWSYKYARPSDCLSVYSVNENALDTEDPKWEVEGDYIVTDEIDSNDQIEIQYIKQITDPTKFSQMFINLFVLKLASRLAITITNDKSLKDFLLGQFNIELLNMLALDARRRNPGREEKLTSWQSAGH